MHKDRRIKMRVRERNWAKTIVYGMLERGGKVRTKVTADRNKVISHETIREAIAEGSELMTDEFNGYMGLSPDFAHNVINHMESYVQGRVHTQGIENFWSLLKRGLNGTYISVEPFHLFRYLDEQAYRYNNRKEMDDYDRFTLAMSQIVGKRLTWDQLTGKEATPTQIN